LTLPINRHEHLHALNSLNSPLWRALTWIVMTFFRISPLAVQLFTLDLLGGEPVWQVLQGLPFAIAGVALTREEAAIRIAVARMSAMPATALTILIFVLSSYRMVELLKFAALINRRRRCHLLLHFGATAGGALLWLAAIAGGCTRLVWQSTQVTSPWASKAWDCRPASLCGLIALAS